MNCFTCGSNQMIDETYVQCSEEFFTMTIMKEIEKKGED